MMNLADALRGQFEYFMFGIRAEAFVSILKSDDIFDSVAVMQTS
jgi:hypothetical protein